MYQKYGARALALCGVLLLTGCGGLDFGRFTGGGNTAQTGTQAGTQVEEDTGSSFWDLFERRGDQGQVGSVNKYIWNAALETLDFLPVQSVDPFTGVITTGFGTPPGGGKAYRATILVNDPALDARSLNVALITRSGPAAGATVRAVEDAILTRARQLRKRDSGL